MLMRGDVNKIIEQFNGIVEGAFKRIEVLEDKVMALETTPETKPEPKKATGRPKKDPKEF